jgi:hypothetical protein
VRIRLLVLAAGPALAIAGTASTTATKLLGSIGPVPLTINRKTRPAHRWTVLYGHQKLPLLRPRSTLKRWGRDRGSRPTHPGSITAPRPGRS